MPNFHTHWLVALQAITSAPKSVNDGFNRYVLATRGFKNDILAALLAGREQRDPDVAGSIRLARQAWETSLQSAPTVSLPGTWDDVACFSAYMLGACGPDFWVVPSVSFLGQIPDFAARHFDLGHYNRTHRQFQLSVERAGGGTDRQSLVNQAYFCGMATHFGADLVIHQLVNVSAGAYNLLAKTWENEHGALGKNIWSAHNKVEHSWDTWIRYRYLSDFGPVWGDDGKDKDKDGKDAFSPFGAGGSPFPVSESLVRWVQALPAGVGNERVIQRLRTPSVRLDVEKPLLFPWAFADRVEAVKDGLAPFIYSVVVAKGSKTEPPGAYPREEVHGEAAAEAESFQTTDARELGGRSERRRLAYFSSRLNNRPTPIAESLNYLTYTVCPNFERMRQWGRSAFYDEAALLAYMRRAVPVAGAFLLELRGAYETGPSLPADQVRLSNLARFWNLDTGLGLRVVKGTSETERELITILDFTHVFELPSASGKVEYTRGDGYLAGQGNPEETAPTPREAFPTHAAQPFPGLGAVQEKEGSYLEAVRMAPPEAIAVKAPKLDDFFTLLDDPGSQQCTAPTQQASGGTGDRPAGDVCAILRTIYHRLNLVLRVPIPVLGGRAGAKEETVGLFFYGDRARGLGDSAKELPPGTIEDPVQTHEWMTRALTEDHLLTFESQTKRADGKNGLAVFWPHLFANLERLGSADELEEQERKGELARKIDAGTWNAYVPYTASKSRYGRNFAIGTGRQFVLAPVGTGNFLGAASFSWRRQVYPTEQVFFTLYVLVRTAGCWFDLLSKEKVAEDQLTALKRIDATGFVKIVLFYDVRSDGAVQLDECYVDGLRTPVRPYVSD